MACIFLLLLPQGGWKLSLRTGFKNFRRDHPDDENMPAEGSRGTSSTDSPLSKRRKTVDIEDTISAEEYEEAITQMKTEHSKKRGKNHALIKTLMEETRSRRRIWITQEFPMVKEILEKFPFVSSAKTVSPSWGIIVVKHCMGGGGELECSVYVLTLLL